MFADKDFIKPAVRIHANDETAGTWRPEQKEKCIQQMQLLHL